MSSYRETIVAHAMKILTANIPIGGRSDGKFVVTNSSSPSRVFRFVLTDVTETEPVATKDIRL